MRVNQGVAAAMLVAAIAASTMLMNGCRIENDKHGDADNVKIATPFGGMSVKTNEAAGIDAIGLPVYPGATMVKKKDKNDGAADINLSFGSFTLKVKAASYTTPDSPDLVAAFYRKALGRYGDVIQCQNDKPVSSQTRTAEGLTCADDQKNHDNQDIGHCITAPFPRAFRPRLLMAAEAFRQVSPHANGGQAMIYSPES